MNRIVRDPARDDSVQFYNDLASVMSEMGRILCVALDQGHAAVCIVSEPTRRAFEDQLSKRGIDVAEFRNRHQYVVLDAAETLPKITTNGDPDPILFAEVIGRLIDRLSDQHKGVWMYSELAPQMWRGGNQAGALALEKMWASFADTHPVCLCLAFPVEILSWPIVIEAMQQVVADHLRTLAKGSTLALAVRRGPEAARRRGLPTREEDTRPSASSGMVHASNGEAVHRATKRTRNEIDVDMLQARRKQEHLQQQLKTLTRSSGFPTEQERAEQRAISDELLKVGIEILRLVRESRENGAETPVRNPTA
jgi:hypothetical protein